MSLRVRGFAGAGARAAQRELLDVQLYFADFDLLDPSHKEAVLATEDKPWSRNFGAYSTSMVSSFKRGREQEMAKKHRVAISFALMLYM